MKPETKRALLLLAAYAWSLRYDYLAACIGVAGVLHSDPVWQAWLIGASLVTLVSSWIPIRGKSLACRAYLQFARYATSLNGIASATKETP